MPAHAQLKTACLTALVATAAGCGTSWRSEEVSPAQFVRGYQPEQIRAQVGASQLTVDRPVISGDTLAGRVFDRPISIALASVLSVAARPEHVRALPGDQAVRVSRCDRSRCREWDLAFAPRIRGRFVALRGDTLWMTAARDSAPVAVPLAQVGRIEIPWGRKSHAGVGAMIGAFAGAVLGAVIGSTAEFCILIGAPAGLGLGAGIGAAIWSERWQEVRGDRLRSTGPPRAAIGIGSAVWF